MRRTAEHGRIYLVVAAACRLPLTATGSAFGASVKDQEGGLDKLSVSARCRAGTMATAWTYGSESPSPGPGYVRTWASGT